ncbi:cytochrome B [Thiohalorhabdus denitrificans]|uniref:Cytochrome b561 n=1 Tax=Thiohalorhabdus denitrificans TaxID=381306 RepID=A0A0N8PNE6_9GAMM|nr:cytochrome b [Thiohalorhabdus denitrificans]KPV41309.1 cytochrome B [Thiohalorhabdus denitrificans]SCY22569.1 Cytochrome b561 [Thiohalorhabdus denitrificans]
MQWRNTSENYGWLAIGLHWLIAVGVLGLFGLGLWMVELTYYDDWYNRAPALHKGFGILVLALTLARLLWRWANPAPVPEGRPMERRLGPIVHRAMLALLVAVLIAGYLISTAEGRSIDVFGWFQVPATLHGLERQEDIAGWLHRWLSYALIALVALHAAAALKHHFLDRDRTLLRMLRPGNPERPNR